MTETDPRPTTTRRRLIGAGFGLPVLILIGRALSEVDRAQSGHDAAATYAAVETRAAHNDPTAYVMRTVMARDSATLTAISPAYYDTVTASTTAAARATEEAAR